jgi:tyrosyl-tRNA synthetase
LKSEFLKIMQERGFLHQCSNLEGLDAHLASAPRSGYCGFDPTARSLHVGHLVPIMMMYWFQQTGNKPYTLVGGGTGLVGDPSFKDTSRPVLTRAEIDSNAESIRGIYAQFIHYGNGPSDAVMVNNADWLMKLNYLEFLRDFGTYFTINRMLSFDSVKLRLDREQPLTFLEFNYMIMQGYDFLHLFENHGITLQMGGSDQWGNMINGVDLTHKKLGKEVFVATVPLLTTASGQKMGKTAGGAVWLRADMTSPYDFWQYWRNTEDADVGKFLKLFTALPMDEINRLSALQGADINDAKKILAFEVTKLCHGEKAAEDAAATAKATFEQGGAGEDLPTIMVTQAELKTGLSLADLYVHLKLCDSKGEFRRLVTGGGVRVNDQPVTDPAITINQTSVNDQGLIKLSAGKKRHGLVKISG